MDIKGKWLACGVAGMLFMTGCSAGTKQAMPEKERDVIYQISTLNALINGNYDGYMTLGELKSHGDIGIGTFESLDGELIMVGGEVYKMKADGQVQQMPDDERTPFAAVTYMDEDHTLEMADIESLDQLKLALDEVIVNKELFHVFKIDANFSYVKTRSVPKQSKPYPILSEVTKNQPVFEYQDIAGTLVGIWCPEYIGGVNVPGYHLHFVAQDHTGGGHLLDVGFGNGTAIIDVTNGFKLHVPSTTAEGAISDTAAEINKVEQ